MQTKQRGKKSFEIIETLNHSFDDGILLHTRCLKIHNIWATFIFSGDLRRRRRRSRRRRRRRRNREDTQTAPTLLWRTTIKCYLCHNYPPLSLLNKEQVEAPIPDCLQDISGISAIYLQTSEETLITIYFKQLTLAICKN